MTIVDIPWATSAAALAKDLAKGSARLVERHTPHVSPTMVGLDLRGKSSATQLDDK